jgi:hypothetical protein
MCCDSNCAISIIQDPDPSRTRYLLDIL